MGDTPPGVGPADSPFVCNLPDSTERHRGRFPRINRRTVEVSPVISPMSVQSRLFVLAIVTLLVFAGCVSQPGNEVATESTIESPPGVENNSLVNASVLLDAHVETLSTTGFVVRETINTSHRGDRAVVWQNSSMRYAAQPDLDSFRVQPGGARITDPAVWANETVVLARDNRGDEVSYHRPPRGWTPPVMLTGAKTLQSYFEFATYTSTGTTPCDDTSCLVFKVDASSANNITNLTGKVLIDSHGVVHRMWVEHDRVANNRTYHIRYRFDLVRSGNVSVERPGWVDEGLERT